MWGRGSSQALLVPRPSSLVLLMVVEGGVAANRSPTPIPTSGSPAGPKPSTSCATLTKGLSSSTFESLAGEAEAITYRLPAASVSIAQNTGWKDPEEVPSGADSG